MCPIAWMSSVQVQAIPLPTMDRTGPDLRAARVSSDHRAPATPVVWPELLCPPMLWLWAGCMAGLQSEKKRAADGTRFGGQRVFIFALPSQRTPEIQLGTSN
ncbi:UNVERIFIED_CONTAM: hypothetical protein FKN15_037289 [Acipenser sinensis]